MRHYSRRQFLQLAGVILLNTKVQFSWLHDSLQTVVQGRALEATPVYTRKTQPASIVRHLWPDSITTIYDDDENWYRVPEGFVPRCTVQPMISYMPYSHIAGSPIPFWAQVATPVAPVRQWCAAHAPPVTRIGHGGIGRVIDYLPGDESGAGWYGLDSGSGDFLGWTQAVHWQPVREETLASDHATLHIDQREQILTAYDDGDEALRAPLSTGTDIVTGTYRVIRRQFSGAPVSISAHIQTLYGVPWRVQFGENYEISGAYWHNRFGAPVPGPAVQVTPFLACWLYQWLGDDGIVTVS